MKKIYYLLLISGFYGNAQIANIPDPNFLQKLLDNPVINVNGDDQIQISELQGVTHLYLDSSEISSLEGIEQFPDLVFLEVSINNLTHLDISQTNINYLDCRYNDLTTLLLNPEVQHILCQTNQLSTLDLSGVILLKDLNIAENLLTSIEFPQNCDFSEGALDIGPNLFTSIELPSGPIDYFSCWSSQLTELDLSNVTSFGTNVTIHANLQLQHINFRNGNTEGGETSFVLYGNELLESICVDDENEGAILLQSIENPLATYTFYCDFEPATRHNTVTGTLNFGGDCTNPVPNVALSYTDTSNTGTTFSNAAGGYTVYPYIGDGNVTIVPQVSPYFTVTPAAYTSEFTGFGNTATANFCLAPNGIHPDLEVTIFPVTDAMPGFDAQYQLVVKNKGTEIQSCTVSLAFEDAKLDFISSDPLVQNQVENNITWDIIAIVPFETRTYNVIFNVNSPMETPAVNNGDVLPFTAVITSSETEETPVDNSDHLDQVVVGSYDPNDIRVLEGATIGPEQTDDYLTYLVRFQNSGTAPATNVVVKDVIADNLDPSTIQILASSHSFRSTLTDSNKLEFFFENIMLPAEMNDEPGSHGFIAYRMKPVPSVGLGSIMEKIANIYFDYNWPIVTNTASTIVTALAVNDYDTNIISLYPNPVRDSFQISIDAGQPLDYLAIYNLLGQKVITVGNPAHDQLIDVSGLVPGMYMVKINKVGISIKFIKM